MDLFKEAVERGKSRVVVGFQFRYHPGLIKIRELLNNGSLGRPVSLRSHWGEYLPDWHPWEDYRLSYSARADLGGGVALTLSHPLDYLRWLMGDAQVLWSFGTKVSDLEISVEDLAEMGLIFNNVQLVLCIWTIISARLLTRWKLSVHWGQFVGITQTALCEFINQATVRLLLTRPRMDLNAMTCLLKKCAILFEW